MELMENPVNVLFAFFLGASDIGVKGAVGALAPAEREMEVEVHSEVYWGIGGLEDLGLVDWRIWGLEDLGIGGLEDWRIGGLGDL